MGNCAISKYGIDLDELKNIPEGKPAKFSVMTLLRLKKEKMNLNKSVPAAVQVDSTDTNMSSNITEQKTELT
jgi:hypothetical protein